MAKKHKHAVLSDSAAAAEEEDPTRGVCIETTLDTRLIIPVSRNDVVSDMRRRIEKEHALCFSNIGKIVVHALKVKRRGQYYHLPNSLLVKDAFGLVGKNWFLSVDASVVKKRGKRRDNSESLGVHDNALVAGVDLALDGTPEQETRDDRNRGRKGEDGICRHDILEKRGVLVEAALQRDLVRKERKRKIVAVNEDLQEDVGLGKDVSEPPLRDKERSENLDFDSLTVSCLDDNHLVMDSSGTHKVKKRKKSKCKFNQEFDGVDKKCSGEEFNVASEGENGKTPSEYCGVSTNPKHSNTSREVGDQELLLVDTRHKTDKTEEETSAPNKMQNLKDCHPFDVESNPPAFIKEPKDVQIEVGVSGRKDIGSSQAETSQEQGALSKKNDSSRMQLNNFDSAHRDETMAGTKVVDATADLVDENGSVVPTDTGKRKKRRKKIKSGEQLDDKAANEENDLSPTNGNEVLKGNIESSFAAKEDDNGAGDEVKTVENKEEPANKEEEPVKKKSKKKQKPAAISLPDVQIELQDATHQNPTQQTVTKNEVVASSITKKVKAGKLIKDQVEGILESENLVVQNAVKSVSPKSTRARSDSLGHVDNGSCDEAEVTEDIHPKTDETSALNNMETLKNHLSVNHENNLPSRQAERVEEHGALSKENESCRIQSNDIGSPNQDETEVKTRDVDITANLVDENESVVPTDTGKKRKRSKKTKGSVGNVLTTLGGRDVQGSETIISAEPLGAESDKQPDGESRNEESGLSPSDGYEILRENTESTFVVNEDDGNAGNGVKTIENEIKPSSMEEEPVTEKSKKKRRSRSKKTPNVQIELEDVNQQKRTLQTVTKSDALASSNTKKKREVGTLIQDQLNKGKLESKNFGIQNDPAPVEPKPVRAKFTKEQSHSLDHGDKVTSGANSQMKVSEMGNKSILEKHLPSIAASSEILDNKKRVPKTAANSPKAKKNDKNDDAHSVQTSLNAQSPVKPNGKYKIAGKSPVLAQEALFEEKSEASVHSEKNLPKASNKAAKALPSDASKETGRQNVVNDTGKNINSKKTSDSITVSNPRLEKPRNVTSQGAAEVIDVKVSDKDNGATIKGSEAKKMIATPGSIFRDDSDVSSGDEGANDSDATTETPSDFSSDYSDGEESNANFKSPQKGSITSDQTKSVDKRNILKSRASVGKDFTFDSLLRSSSRYKKAQLTASQLQLEYENQEIDFVRDSQPNQ